jgi:hypothetical protein
MLDTDTTSVFVVPVVVLFADVLQAVAQSIIEADIAAAIRYVNFMRFIAVNLLLCFIA